MATSPPDVMTRLRYEDAAQAYLHSLTMENFMESTPQATQREITLESLALVRAVRPDVQVFNELLVQYPQRGKRIGQIVPDNMVVVWPEPIVADGSYDMPVQPTRPFWVMEYVSKSNRRKDYDRSFPKYEQHLKVPYFLLFVPDADEMTLYRRRRARYQSVRPDADERYAIPELDMKVGLLAGWVRYWFRGELLDLPGDLLRSRDEARQQRDAAQQQRDAAQQQRDAATQQLEDAQRQLEAERQSRTALEAELARLRSQTRRGRP
jgi:Uma2 family endonuclease